MIGRRLAQIHQSPLPRRSRDRSRETFIALRACRQAIKVARGMLFSRPIDIVHMHCQTCGTEVDCSIWDNGVGIKCSACGEAVRVPGYLRCVRKIDEPAPKHLHLGEKRHQAHWSFLRTVAATLLFLMAVGSLMSLALILL